MLGQAGILLFTYLECVVKQSMLMSWGPQIRGEKERR